MAEKKKKAPRKFTKEYQGGRRRLKDVDKSGKRDFGDTFLGDLIGADGKIGIKKGRPGLRASLKGERREKDAKPKRKVSSPIKKTSSGIIKGDFTRKDDIEVTKLSPAKKPEIKKPTPSDPPRRGGPQVKTKPTTKPSTTSERQKEAFKKFTSKQWEDMSVDERRRKFLPPTLTALTAGKYRNFKFKDGTSPLDLERQLKRMGRFIGFDMNEGGSVSKKKKGYAKGGLKATKPDQKGLKKLPTSVRNKMGYMSKGGMAKKGVMSYNMGGMVKSQVNNLKKTKR